MLHSYVATQEWDKITCGKFREKLLVGVVSCSSQSKGKWDELV